MERVELKMGAQRGVGQQKEERHVGRLNRCSSIQNRACPEERGQAMALA